MEFEIKIKLSPNIDLNHALESITDACFYSSNVTTEEMNLVIQMLGKLINKYENSL